MKKISSNLKKNENYHCGETSFKINQDCLKNYDKILYEIFKNYNDHKFILDRDIKLEEFTNFEVINDIRNDLLTRKSNDKIELANELVSNCYYGDISVNLMPIRLLDNDKKF